MQTLPKDNLIILLLYYQVIPQLKCPKCGSKMFEDSDSFETWNGYEIENWWQCSNTDCGYSPENTNGGIE